MCMISFIKIILWNCSVQQFTFYSRNKTYRNYLKILLSEKCFFVPINFKKHLIHAALTIFSSGTSYLLIKKNPSKSTIRADDR